MSLVDTCRQLLRTLEFRIRDTRHVSIPTKGFYSCLGLAACPRLESLSLSIPQFCRELFQNQNAR